MLSINDINLLKSQNEGLKKQNEQLQKENKQKSYSIGNLGYKIHNQRKEINQRLKQIEALRKECEELKAQIETYSNMLDSSEFRVALTDIRTGEREVWRKLGNKAQRYKQALDDIEEICKFNFYQAIIRQSVDSSMSYLNKIKDIISKAKDGNNE